MSSTDTIATTAAAQIGVIRFMLVPRFPRVDEAVSVAPANQRTHAVIFSIAESSCRGNRIRSGLVRPREFKRR